MSELFLSITPDVIFDAAETLGGRCTGRFLALNAMENRVYSIEMEDGTWTVIKFYRPGRWDRPTIQSEHDFLKALHAGEIPVVCPLSDATGKTLFEIQGVFFTIFPKKAGRLEPELNKEQLKRLGRFLARLHNTGKASPAVPRLKLTPQTFGRDSLQTLRDAKLLPSNVDIRFSDLINSICDKIEPLFEKVEWVLLHGDCHAGNILWNKDEPFFIDFDDMLYAPPVQDIWMLTGADDEDGKERKDTLLAAYEQIREFDEESLKLVEPLRTLRMIYFNAWIGRRWEDGAFKMAFPTFGTERYWQEQIEGLAVQREKLLR